ncbi:uncharacterized protein LOC123930068 [Meles meles]|uniref:uncharacterized protein LOC123930068 n=1 Tax=Meles meles TaxID=9662 RepID=UPI001E69C4D3|nr:uncharacterized protein LOC123930068 [Meles meles]
MDLKEIEDESNIVNSVFDGKVELKDLLSALENLEKTLSEEKPEASLNSATDENNKIVKDIIDVFTNSSKPSTPFNNLLKEITTLDKIRNDKMPANELSFQLLKAGIPLTNKTFQEILGQASADENSEVSLKQILESLNTNKPVPQFEDLSTALQTVNLMDSNKIQINNLQDAFDDLNVSVRPEEHQMLEKTLDVDEKGEVSLKTALLALKSNKRLQDFREVKELANALNKVTNEKVDADEVKSILKGLGIYCPKEELQEVLTSIPLDNEGKVDLKDCLTQLKKMPYFTKVSKKEGPLKTLAAIRKNMVTPEDLGSIMKNIGVPLPEDVLERLLQNMTLTEDGKVNLEEFMSNLTNSGFSPLPERSRVDDSNLDTFPGNMRMEMSGETVAIRDLNEVLRNVGIELTKEEDGELRRKLPVDAKGETDLKTLVDTVQDIRGEADLSELDNVLRKMGIKPSPKGHLQPEKSLPVNASRNMYKNKLLTCPEDIKGLQVDDHDLDSILENMAVRLPAEELSDVALTPPVDVNGKFGVNILTDGMDGVKAVTGGKVNVSNLDSILGEMRIKLPQKEREKLTENLLLNGEIIDVNKVGAPLQNIGMDLSEEEINDLTYDLPVDVQGKVEMIKHMDGIKPFTAAGNVFQNRMLDNVKSIKANGKVELGTLMDAGTNVTGGEVNVSDIQSILEKTGIELTDKECLQLKKYLPVDAVGKVYQNRLMDGLKALKGGIVDVAKLDTALQSMGMKLTGVESNDLIKNLPVDDNGKVKMKKLMDALNAFSGGMVKANNLDNVLENLGIELTEKEREDLTEYLPPNANGKIGLKNLMEAVETVTGGEVDVSDVGNVLENMGVTVTDKECGELVKNLPVNANGKVYKNRLLDGLKSLHGKQIDANDLLEILGNMGIELTQEEFVKLKQTVPIDAAGKVYQKRLLDGVKSLKGGMVKANNLDNVLENLGIELTEKEREDLTEYLPPNGEDSNGKIGLKNLMEAVETITGGEVDVSDVGNVLENMGVTVTDKECGELVKNLPVNANGKVYKNRLLDGLKSLHGGVVNVNKLDSVLRTMGWKLTEDEIKDLKCSLPTDVYGRAAMKKLFDGLKATKGKKMNVQHVPDFVSNLGVALTDKENQRLLKKLPVDASGKIYQNRLLDNLKSFTGGKVERSKVNTVLENMGIELTGKELQSLTDNLPVDGNGKVDFDKLMDGVKALTGGEIDASDVGESLGNIGLELTKKELLTLLKNLPITADGKIYQNRLMDAVKSLRGGMVDVNKLDTVLGNMGMSLTEEELKDLTQNLPENADGKIAMEQVVDAVKSFTGEKVDLDNLENVLKNMGIELTDPEYTKLVKALPVSADGKADLSEVVDGVKAITGEKADLNSVKTVLENLGKDLKDKELLDLIKHRPSKDDDKIFQNRLLKVVKSLKDGKFNVNDLSAILDNMGIKISDNELKALTKNLPADVDRKISLKRPMNEMKANFTGEIDPSDLKNFLGSLGIELTDEEKEKLLKTLPVDGEKVCTNELDNTLKKLGIELTEEELAKLSENLEVDANGMVDLKEVMDEVKVTTDDNKVFKNRLLEGVKSLKGGKVNINNLDTVLNNLGIKLADTELKDLVENIDVGVDEKIPLETLMENITDFTGEKIESSNLKNVLGNLGIEFADKELEEMLKILPIDANGKLYRNRLLKAMKSPKSGKMKTNNLHTNLENMGMRLTEEEFAELSGQLQVDANGNVDLPNLMGAVKAITGKVDIKNLETVVGNMGIDLTDKELEDLKQNLPVGGDNKVALEILKDKVKAFTGEKIDASDLQNILKDMGIELTDKEHKHLLKTLPIDAHEKVFQNRLLKGVKYNKRGKVDVNNLDPVLEALEVKLTEQELNLLKDLLSGYKKVDLKNLMDKVETVTGEELDVNDIGTILRNMGIELTDKELSQLMKTLPVDNGKVYQRRLLDGIKFLKGGKIDSSKVDAVLENIGMDLTEKELKDITQNLPVEVKGKVDLEKLMNEVKSFSGGKVDANKLGSVLQNLGIELTPNELLNLVKTLPLDEGDVDVNKLDTLLENMGISIKEKEFMDLIERLPDAVFPNTIEETVLSLLSILGRLVNS